MIGKKKTFANNKIKYPEAEISNVSVIFFHAAKILLTDRKKDRCKS
jgi:hypothetical protein